MVYTKKQLVNQIEFLIKEQPEKLIELDFFNYLIFIPNSSLELVIKNWFLFNTELLVGHILSNSIHTNLMQAIFDNPDLRYIIYNIFPKETDWIFDYCFKNPTDGSKIILTFLFQNNLYPKSHYMRNLIQEGDISKFKLLQECCFDFDMRVFDDTKNKYVTILEYAESINKIIF